MPVLKCFLKLYSKTTGALSAIERIVNPSGRRLLQKDKIFYCSITKPLHGSKCSAEM